MTKICLKIALILVYVFQIWGTLIYIDRLLPQGMMNLDKVAEEKVEETSY